MGTKFDDDEERRRKQQQERLKAQEDARKADQAEAARQAANLRMQKNAMHSEERISDENDNTAHFAPKTIDKKTHQVTSGGQINDNFSGYIDYNEAAKHVTADQVQAAHETLSDILGSSHSSKKYKAYFGDSYIDTQKQSMHSEDTAFLAKDNPADTSLQAAYDSAVKSLKSKKELSMNGAGDAYNLMSWDNPTTQTSMKGAYNPFKDQNGSLEDYYADQYKQAQQNYNYVPNGLQNAIAAASPVGYHAPLTDQQNFAAVQARINASPADQYAYQVANRSNDSTGWQTGNLSDMDKAELQRYQNVVDAAAKDKNAKTLNPYETYRYHNLMYGSLTDAQRKAVDNYQTAYDEYQGAQSDLKNAASDADAEANYASIGLTSNRKDNATLRANVVSAKQKVEQARNSMRAAGLTDEQINKFVGSDDTDNTYKNSYLGYNRSYKDYLDTQDEAKQVTGRIDAWGLYNRAASAVVSSAASPITNIGSFINSLEAKSADPGTSKNVYGNKLNNAMDAYRAGNSAYMGKTYGKAGEFLYNAAQSAGDSFVNGMIMGPVANKVSGAVGKALGNGTKAAYVVDKLSNLVGSSAFGAGAYADRIREGQERGQSAAGTQAAAVGAGLAEMVTEAWSLDSFTDILTKKGAAAMRNTLSNILVQAGVEGSEEAAGDIMNRVIDDAANGKNSEYKQAVSAYQKQGMTEKQAKKKANVDFLSDTLQDALAGALSGGVLGGGAHVMNNMQTAQQAQTETAGYTSEDFRNTAESYKKASEGMADTGAQRYYNDAAKAANDIADRMDSGKKVSSSLYSKLYNSAYEAEGIESENRKPAEEKQEVTPDDQVRFNVPEGAKTVEEALNANDSAQDKVSSMDRIFARKSNNMSAGNVHAAMQSAQTAQELVTAKREADMSTDASARDISNAYYNLYQGRMIQNGQATAEDFQKAEASPTMQEVYQAAKEGHALNISESDPMDLRMAQNAGKQANILLNSNSVLENQDLSTVQIHPATQKSEAYATIDGKDYSLDSLNDTIQNRALRVRVAGASQQSTQELADLYLKDAPQGMSEGRWNTTFSTLEAGGSAGRNFDEAYKAIGGSAAMVDADTARQIYNAGAVAAQAQISENVKRSGQSVARYGTGSVIDSRKNSTEALPYMPVVEAMAKATGVDFYLSDDAPSNINGTFDRAMSRVMINTNNPDAVLNTLFHEGMGEYMQAYNPEGYKSVQKLVSDYLVDTDGLKSVAAIGKKYQRAYQAVEGTKSFYDAMSEAVNDSIAGMFSTDEGIKQFTDWTYKHDSKPKSALQNVADYFKRIGEAFHNLVTTGHLSSTSQRTARMAEERANHIRQTILDEMDKAVENSKKAPIDNTAKGSEKYSAHITSVKSRFSLAEPVEQTRDLIAVHNLNEDQLISDITDLGGFPAPSIAIIRQGMEHSKYGPISVLFKKDTIDPKSSRYNKVYGGDAWTPTFPQIEYDVNDDVYIRVHDQLRNLNMPQFLKQEALDFNGTHSGHAEYKGLQGVIDAAESNRGMRAAYVASKGVTINDNATTSDVSKYTDAETKTFDDERTKLEESGLTSEKLRNMKIKDIKAQYGDLLLQLKLNSINRGDPAKAEKFTKKAHEIYDHGTVFAFVNAFITPAEHAFDYYENGNPVHKETQRDNDTIDKQISDNFDDSGFKEWATNLYDGIVRGTGIPNGADPYTYSGEEKSFRQTHYPVTLNNIVKSMRNAQGEKAAGTVGPGTFLVTAVRNFGSVDEMHQHENQLSTIPDDEYTSMTDSISERLGKIADRIGGSNRFIMDTEDNIAAAIDGVHTPSAVENRLKKMGYKVYPGAGQEILDLAEEAADLPTGYFEAKPMRAVGLSEIAEVVAPDNMSDKLRTTLEDNNIPYLTYKAGDEQDRAEKMNGLDTLRFSLGFDDDFFSSMGTEENPDDPDVKHRHELMSEAEKALSDVHVDDKYLKITAKGIIDSFGSSYDSKTLAESLRKVFSYAKTHEGFMGSSDYEGIMDDVLRPVMEASEQTDDTQLNQVKEIMAAHPFHLTEDQMAMVSDDYRGWKAQYPELKVSKNAPSTLDQQFSEIADQLRQAGIADLDESANETDQLTELLDAIDSAQPISLYAFSNEEDAQQAVKDMADTVMTSYLSAAEADAKGQALVRIRTARDRIIDEGKARRQKARQDYQARLSAARKDIAKSNRSFGGQGLSNDENIKRLTSAAENLEAQAKELRSQALSSDAKIDRAKLASLSAKEKASADKAALTQRMREQKAAALERQAQQYRNTVARLKTQYHSKAEQLALTKAKNAEKWKNYHEKQARNTELEKITKSYDSLYKQLMHPTDEKHIPEEFKSAVAEFLDSINMIRPDIRYDNKNGVYRLRIWDGTFERDGKAHYTESGYATYDEAYQAFYRYVFEDNGTLSAKNATIRAKMQGVRDLYEQAAKDEESGSISQLLDPDLYERLKTLSSRNVASLSSDELHTISLALQNIQHAVNYENELFRQAQSPKAIYESIRDHADSVYGRQSHRPGTDKLLDFMSLDNATPETVFHGLGKGGDSVFKEFVKANNMKSRDLRTAQEYMIGDGSTDHGVYKSGALKGVSQKQLQEWSEKSITVHGNIQMTYGQIMGLYELAKRQQAMLHTAGGVTIDNFLDEHHKKVVQGRAYLSASEIQAIVDSNLTTQQKQVADAMQRFMAQECSSWGNEASMLMDGYKKFNEENYYPISVDKKVLSTKNADVAQAAVNAIKNMGMTKAVVPNASNPLVVKDIFDVYTAHVADMATYHSYAAPLADLLRVLNYKEVVERGGYKNYDTVKDAIAKIYGDGGVRYIEKFITDINGRERSNYINPLGWLTSNYKAAAVGWNLRVVRQQPMAVFRAADVISPKYLMEGQILNKDAMEMQDRTSDMTWEKKQGNVDGYIYKSMKQTLTGAATPVEKLRNASMSLAGKADDFTWRRIYNAAYLEQRDKFRKEGKATSGKAFEDAVNDRFDEIIVRTQVTGATILRSQFMRSKDTLNQIQSAFMAEPTKSYNMFLRAAMDAVQQSNGKWIAGKALWGMKKAAAVFLVTQIFTALAQSSVDWIRKDPEDGEDMAEFMLRVYKDNFFDDLNPLSLVPILKDASNSIQSLISWAKGEPTYSDDSRMDIASLNTAIKAVENTAKVFMGKGTVYGALYSDIKAVSQIIGIPAANLMRDVVAMRNKLNNIQSVRDLIGGDWETTMPSQKEKILDAYQYGELGDLASGIVDSKTTDALAENSDDIKDGSIEKASVEKQAKSEALSTILSSFKKEYQAADDTTRKEMKDKLTSQLKSAGFSEEAIDEKLGSWTDVKLKKDANGYKNIDPVTGEKTSVGDVFKTIRTGSGDYKKEIEKAVKAGKTYKKIETDITSTFKAQYLADYQKSPSSVSQLKNRLTAVYKYLDDQEIKEGTQQKETTSRQWLDDPAAYLKNH